MIQHAEHSWALLEHRFELVDQSALIFDSSHSVEANVAIG